MSDRDLDAEFERIIAGWDDEAPDPQLRDRGPSTEEPDAAAPAPVAGDALAPSDPTTDAATDRTPEPNPDSAGERAQPGRGTDPATPPAAPGTPAPPATPTPPGTPAPGPAGSSGLLELPIAPTTSHAWRSGAPRRDDADDLLDAVDADDDHFVPPSEIDLPSAETDPMFWAIVGGLVGGPLLLLYVLFFDRDGSGWWVATALAMIVVGFVLLVLRGGTERDPFDDGTRL